MKPPLLLLILLMMFVVPTWAYDFSAVAPSGQTLYYNITSSTSPYTVSVTYPGTSGSATSYWNGYTKPTGDLTIPSTVTHGDITYSVTAIGNASFAYCGLSSVSIPNTVTTIGASAFYYCVTLTSVSIPNSVISIGDIAFYWCNRLTSVNIPNSVTYLGEASFNFCSALASVTIGNSVTAIHDNTFYNCTSMASLSIGNSVTSIGSNAFFACGDLTSVTIPSTVTSLGTYAFYACDALTSITMERVTPPSLGYEVFGEVPLGSVTLNVPCGATSAYRRVNLWNSFGAITEMCGCSTTYSFDTVTANGSYVWNGNTYTESGDYTTTLTNAAGCDSIVSLHLVIEPPTHYLLYAVNDGAITIYGHTDTPNSDAYSRVHSYGIYSWPDVVIPDSISYDNTTYPVTAINGAFSGCTTLTSITIPNTVTSIGRNSFYNCSGLTTVILSDSLITIGDNAFTSCSNLESINIPNSVTSIGNYSFSSCTNLENIVLPNTLTTIGNGMFLSCKKLAAIHIPDSVESIKLRAFDSCCSLTSITIPRKVSFIEDRAFSNCANLSSVFIDNPVPPLLGANVFMNNDVSNDTLFVPCGASAAYLSADQWNSFGTILEPQHCCSTTN